jgi:hypothetical protein
MFIIINYLHHYTASNNPLHCHIRRQNLLFTSYLSLIYLYCILAFDLPRMQSSSRICDRFPRARPRRLCKPAPSDRGDGSYTASGLLESYCPAVLIADGRLALAYKASGVNTAKFKITLHICLHSYVGRYETKHYTPLDVIKTPSRMIYEGQTSSLQIAGIRHNMLA